MITVATEPAADLARAGTGRTGGAPVVASAASPDPNSVPADGSNRPGWKFGTNTNPKLIVIDPGHGGADSGTAHNGLVEKSVTLDIAQRLRSVLTAQGWTVRLTRETDVDPVSSREPRQDARRRQAERRRPGLSADPLRRREQPRRAALHQHPRQQRAARERARHDRLLVQAAGRARSRRRSRRASSRSRGTADDGTRHENFYVVRHTAMPAVLIETAFATNPGDVALAAPALVPSERRAGDRQRRQSLRRRTERERAEPAAIVIGLYDSGLGGLTVLAALRAAGIDQDVVYFADQAHVPYGEQSDGELHGFLTENLALARRAARRCRRHRLQHELRRRAALRLARDAVSRPRPDRSPPAARSPAPRTAASR